jgi:hypothetical protein
MRLYRKIKNFLVYDFDSLRARCQRFIRGYSYGDVWDMDCWFKRTVKPMLIHLRDHGIGIPFDLYQEGAENERAAWEAVLTEMVECIDLMDEDEAQKYLGIADDDYSAESYKKVNDFMDEKKDRFFELFGKYFFSLWD